MILSASRRTDIPAFYGEWLEKRLKEGRVQIPNPFRPRWVKELQFSPETVECIVFWTKNAVPFIPRLPGIQGMGYSFYFQYTLTPYGLDIEPGLFSKRTVLENMLRLGEICPVVWRYDPILLTNEWPVSRHEEAFGQLCRRLAGSVCRCVISFVDAYPGQVSSGLFPEAKPEEMDLLAEAFGRIGKEHNLPIFTCAEKRDFSPFSIQKSACIDPELVWLATGCRFALPPDKNQRKACGCARSVDIGVYGSCLHGCRYCYASGGRNLARLAHCPDSLRLLGGPLPGEEIRAAVLVSEMEALL